MFSVHCSDSFQYTEIVALQTLILKRSIKSINFRKAIMDGDQNNGKEVKAVEESAPKKLETDSNAGATSPPPTTS